VAIESWLPESLSKTFPPSIMIPFPRLLRAWWLLAAPRSPGRVGFVVGLGELRPGAAVAVFHVKPLSLFNLCAAFCY